MKQTIQEFYNNKSVFLTGVTGFLGGVFLEKLLYSCPDIGEVYVLIRPKKDKKDRLAHCLNSVVFTRIREEKPELLKKIKPIIGDIVEPNLGITAEDEKVLIDKVAVVFHLAASVMFNLPLDVAINTNTLGTKRVIDLVKRMKIIEKFVYVSTAYSNVHHKVLEERVYAPPVSLEMVNEILNQKVTKADVKSVTRFHPNTYTFSKCLAEFYVAQAAERIPYIIIRPSIVSGSMSEPIEGWINYRAAAASVTSFIGRGYIRYIKGMPDNKVDLIPVDYVAHLIIVAAAKSDGNKLQIYNMATSSTNPLSLWSLFDFIRRDFIKNKSYDLRIPKFVFLKSSGTMSVLSFLFEKLSAFTADAFLILQGLKPRYVKRMLYATKARNVVNPFTTNDWTFKTDRTLELALSLSPSERKQFPFNPIDIDWPKYLEICCNGLRKFLPN